jgi:hypothetical protein
MYVLKASLLCCVLVCLMLGNLVLHTSLKLSLASRLYNPSQGSQVPHKHTLLHV